MCGRYAMYSPLEALAHQLGVEVVDFDWYAIYNAAPTMRLPVITGDEPNALQFFRWGLIPSWAKDPSIGNKMINARAETLLEKPSFRNAIRKRRCLIPVNGFYEWKREGKNKTPIYIKPTQGEVMTLAGLWEEWRDPEGHVVRTFTIITCEPNGLMAPIHDRMPAIIPPSERSHWLDPKLPAEDALKMLRPCPDEALTAYPVSKLVNSPLNNVPEVIEPAE